MFHTDATDLWVYKQQQYEKATPVPLSSRGKEELVNAQSNRIP